jgi:ABC-type dipeptide/oligopeptide/nickel transport systems, permease components
MNLSADLFRPLNRSKLQMNDTTEQGMTYWSDVWRRLKNNKAAMFSLIIIAIIILASVLGPRLVPYGYSDQLRGEESQWPNFKHPLGTDSLGRDMLVRILYGARISLSVGFAACFINLTIGVLYGGISGYLGGKIDNILMRIVDIIYSVPTILYVILLSVVLKDNFNKMFESGSFPWLKSAGSGLVSIYIAIGLSYWVVMARIVRGQILSLKEQDYIAAAKSLGASGSRILLRHLIPNCIGPIVVTTMLLIPEAIFTESFLSFIGLGVDAPVPSWGSLASDALGGFRSYFYLLMSPCLAISITILAFNMFGDGLRDALDPTKRK